MDLALNNLQRWICYKTKPNQTRPNMKTQMPIKVQWKREYDVKFHTLCLSALFSF